MSKAERRLNRKKEARQYARARREEAVNRGARPGLVWSVAVLLGAASIALLFYFAMNSNIEMTTGTFNPAFDKARQQRLGTILVRIEGQKSVTVNQSAVYRMTVQPTDRSGLGLLFRQGLSIPDA